MTRWLALLLLSGSAGQLEAAVWRGFARPAVPRQEVAVAAVGGKLYLIGGLSATASLSSVEEYDPIADRWRFVAPLPLPLHHSAAVAIGDHLYVVGGFRTLAFDPTTDFYRYDPRLDRWEELPPLPSPRGAHAAVEVNGRIYVVGGVPTMRALTVFDTATNRWSELPSMPTGREHLAAAALSEVIYVASGRHGGNVAAFEAFHIAESRWEALPPIPTPRSGIAAAAVAGRIYVFGGEGNRARFTGVFEEVESFDVVTRSWRREEPMPVPRHGIAAATIGSVVYLPAGADLQGFGPTNVHDGLDFSGPTLRRRAVRR